MSLQFTQTVINGISKGEVEATPELLIEESVHSLPKGATIVIGVCEQARAGDKPVFFNPPHLDDESRSELLRIMASDALRRAFETHYGVSLAFQNCHAVGGAKDKGSLDNFTSYRSQILAQSPKKRDC